MPVPHSPAARSHFVLMVVSVWATALLAPSLAGAEVSSQVTTDDAVTTVGCELGADTPGCAPDQHLERDAARPARRFASYSDLAALVRGRVSLGLVLSPFSEGAWRRLRVDAEVITWLKDQRGVEVAVRVGVMVHGQRLSGLFLDVTGGYLARVQPGGQVRVGAELGYSRQFASLYVGAAVGVSVEAWARAPQHHVSPSVRLLLGHAFY